MLNKGNQTHETMRTLKPSTYNGVSTANMEDEAQKTAETCTVVSQNCMIFSLYEQNIGQLISFYRFEWGIDIPCTTVV